MWSTMTNSLLCRQSWPITRCNNDIHMYGWGLTTRTDRTYNCILTHMNQRQKLLTSNLPRRYDLAYHYFPQTLNQKAEEFFKLSYHAFHSNLKPSSSLGITETMSTQQYRIIIEFFRFEVLAAVKMTFFWVMTLCWLVCRYRDNFLN